VTAEVGTSKKTGTQAIERGIAILRLFARTDTPLTLSDVARAVAIQPNGTYYQTTVTGTNSGVLTGPAGADFDLYLQKWNGSAWANVASGTGSTANESVSYSGTAGYYQWKVLSYSGSGSYTLCISHP